MFVCVRLCVCVCVCVCVHNKHTNVSGKFTYFPISVGNRGNEQSFMATTVSDLIIVRHSGTLCTQGREKREGCSHHCVHALWHKTIR